MRHGTHVISAKCVSKCDHWHFLFHQIAKCDHGHKVDFTLKNLLPDYGLSILYLWYLINTFIAAHLSLRRRLHSIYQNELKMFESISRITIPCITPSIVVSSSLKSFSEFLLNKWQFVLWRAVWILWWRFHVIIVMKYNWFFLL